MSSETATRLHALDLVRGTALLLGIAFHAGLSFYPSPEPSWIVMDADRSQGIAWTGFVLHIFRMTTFFLLAGYFGRMVHHRRGAWGFLKSRTKRIVLPLMIFWPAMMVSLTALFIWALIEQYGMDPATAPPPPPMTAETFPWTHLWFLYVLLWMYAGMLILRLPLALLDRQGTVRRSIERGLLLLMRSPLLPLALAVPVMAALLGHAGWAEWWGIPTPDYGVVPNTASLTTYGLAFALGWGLNRSLDLLAPLRRFWFVNLVSGAGAAGLCLYLLGGQASIVSVLEGRTEMIYAASYALAVWFLTFAVIGAALVFASRESRVTRYIADSSYWLYLIHLPIVLAMQIWVFRWDWSAEAKYAFILGVSIPGMLLTYQLVVRHSFVGNLLNGPRRKKS